MLYSRIWHIVYGLWFIEYSIPVGESRVPHFVYLWKQLPVDKRRRVLVSLLPLGTFPDIFDSVFA